MTETSDIMVARELPDLIKPPKRHGRIVTFILREPAMCFGLAILALVFLAAIFAPLISQTDPKALNPAMRLLSPSTDAIFGTDMLGRDVFSRVVYGARVSLMVGFGVAILATVTGLAIGLAAGFVPWLDGIVMRLMDGLMAIPSILLAIALMAVAGASIANVILAIALAEMPRMARLVRSTVLTLRENSYVEAAITSGTGPLGIIRHHILPNAMPPVIVQATYVCASAMVIEAILSFIGAGTPPSIPSWGNIMTEGRSLWQIKPFLIGFPAVFLSLTVLAVNLVGDGLRDRFDPRQI